MSARPQSLELIEIAGNGVPMADVGPLSEFAADACAKTAAHYRTAGFSPPWVSFLARSGLQVVGICAFVAAPTAGRVEIAYHTFPPFEGRGFAAAMVKELLTHARQANPSVELFAHTLAEHNASNAVLRKLGFEFGGEFAHPEEGAVWEWRWKTS